jgi:putative ABC transport system substrate-binding protein
MVKQIVILLTTFAILVSTYSAEAQQAGKIYRVGFLGHVPHTPVLQGRMDAFRQGLATLGYEEGRNIEIVYRYPERKKGRLSRLAELAAEFVREKVDVIVVPAQPATNAARNATKTIPIVVMIGVDRVVKNLRRPEGNVTGLSSMAFEVLGKQLQLFKEAVSGLSKVALLFNPGHKHHRSMVREGENAAKELGLRFFAAELRGPAALDETFRRITAAGVDGVMVLRGGMLASLRPRISDQANKIGLPTMFGLPADAKSPSGDFMKDNRVFGA